MNRKGIILAGGHGTRLYPSTAAISKQLLPVYDKPMIYYPLTTLMLSNIREFLIISTPQDMPSYQRLLQDGSQWGLDIHYAIQPSPDGLAQSLLIAEPFLAGAPSALILGDNIFYGNQLTPLLLSANERTNTSTIFVYPASDPERYGIASFDEQGKVIDIEEKPNSPKSHYAVTGLYYYNADAPAYARTLSPSARGELEITDLNNLYLKEGKLSVEVMERGLTWLDTGTHESLLEAHQLVHTLQHRQGLKIGCPEEVAYRKGYVSRQSIEQLAHQYRHNSYGSYLSRLIAEDTLK